MPSSHPELQGRKYFTPDEANRRLPLVRAIVADLAALANSMRERFESLDELSPGEREAAEDALAADQDRLKDFVAELEELGAELERPVRRADRLPRPDGRPGGVSVLEAGGADVGLLARDLGRVRRPPRTVRRS